MPAAHSKVVVITGASRGIGLEFARQFSSESNTLVVAVVRDATKAQLLDSLLATNKVVLIEGDMTKPESFSSVATKISEVANGKVDVLINNAGAWFGAAASGSKQICESTADEWLEIYRLNTIGPVFFTKALLPMLGKSSLKHVINISSFLANPGFHRATNGGYAFVSYSVAKRALNFATLKYHQEFQKQDYVFITLNPGYVATDLHGDAKDQAPLTAEVSVKRMKSFIDRLTPAESGNDYSLDGSLEPLVY